MDIAVFQGQTVQRPCVSKIELEEASQPSGNRAAAGGGIRCPDVGICEVSLIRSGDHASTRGVEAGVRYAGDRDQRAYDRRLVIGYIAGV